ncbi:endonuclease MutS2 [Acidobacteria bacterium AH-259-A15]|nr:endonuclease MutS2 [Acidobacteria bacterium AH-259-A15]
MDQETLSLLDFPRVLKLVENLAQSPLGKSEIARLSPSKNRRNVEEKLALVEESCRYVLEQGRAAFHGFEDPRPILTDLSIQGRILKAVDFLVLLKVLKLGKHLGKTIRVQQWPLLAHELELFPVVDGLIREIERVIDPSGEVRDKADPELASVRRKQSRFREKAQEHLGGYFTGPRAKFLIPQPYITLRNGRYVIPVKVEHQREIPGVVHATSSSGATLFVEPFTVVPVNNKCLQCQKREDEILQKILRRLSNLLRSHRNECEELVKKLARMDALFACANFSLRYDCVIPRFNKKNVLKLQDAKHPLLLDRLGKEQVVPISVQLDSHQNALLISGPNAGGKTVALKTIGLLSVMAQSGLPVCAQDAELPFFHQILADIGDHQSVSQQLSTFSAHILRMKKIMEVLDLSSLILLDELGTGTDPVYGSVLGIAVIDFFRQSQAMVVATTHHQAIKAFASTTSGVENASVKLDPKSLRPTYRLQLGIAGDSSALEIADQLGLSKAIIDRARSVLTEEDLQAERYLERLRQELELLAQRRQELTVEIETIKEREQDLEVQFERKEQERQQAVEKMIEKWASDFRTETQQFIKSIKDRFEAARSRQEMKRKEALLKEVFRRRMNSQAQSSGSGAGEISKGDWVYHSLFRKPGRVVDLKTGQAIMEIEGKKIATPLDYLERIKQEKPSRKLPANVTLNVVEEEERELNLIGFTVEEALTKADKFLDRAFLSNHREVQIIHGFGTGKLRAALSDFLQDHPHVEEHRVKGGATVVALRE